VAGVELLFDFSAELDVVLSIDPELVPDSLVEDPLVELFVFLPDSRLSVR
jgi:hypothetical protein